jgi:hypothetical protein
MTPITAVKEDTAVLCIDHSLLEVFTTWEFPISLANMPEQLAKLRLTLTWPESTIGMIQLIVGLILLLYHASR